MPKPFIDQARPVWLTREQRDALARIYALKPPAVVGPIIDAWDAAPTDAVEAVRGALLPLRDLDPVNGIDLVKHASRAALRSLGHPEPPERV